MMVLSKSRKIKHYLVLAMSVVFTTVAIPPVHAQLQIPRLPKASASDSSGKRQPKQTFGGQLAVFLGHEGPIQDAVFSPDGSLILTASLDKTARLWDRQGNLLVVFRGHEKSVYTAKFSPNGQQILTTSADKTARLWDRQGNLLSILGGDGHNIFSAEFSPNGQQILTIGESSTDNTAQLWDRQGKLLTVLRGHEDWVRSAVFSPDGQKILTASNDNTARLWNRQGNLLTVLRGHKNPVLSAIFSPNGQEILTSSLSDTTRLWDRQGNLLTVFQQESRSAMFSPDSQQVLTVGIQENHLWDRQGNLLAVFNTNMDIAIYGLNSVTQFSPNGQYIVAPHRDGGTGLWDTKGNLLATFPTASGFSPDGRKILYDRYNTVRLLDVSDVIAVETEKVATLQAFQKDVARNTAQLKVFQERDSTFYGAVFSPDSQKILTVSDDNTARLWDRQGNLLTKIEVGNIPAKRVAQFSPDGQKILTARGNIAQLWDQQGNLLSVLRGHSDTIIHAKFSPNGRYILTKGSHDTVRLWDLQGNLLTTIRGDKNAIDSATLSPDGRQILTFSTYKNAKTTPRLWDRSGNLLTVFRGHEDSVLSAKFSPDGRQILTSSADKTARLWDHSGNLLTVFRGHKDSVLSTKFSPDGRQILTSGADKTVRLWDRSGNLLTTFQGHEDSVFSAKFSPDGQQILTSSADKTDRLWDRQGNLVAIQRHGERYRPFQPVKACYSSQGQKILTVGDQSQTIRLWSQGSLLATLRGHDSNINSAEFSPDCRQIITTSMDRTARLWDVATAISLQTEETTAQQNSQAIVSSKNAPQAKAALQAALQLNQQGTIGSRQQALQKLDEALKLYRTDNNMAKAAHILRLIGKIYTNLGQFQAALKVYIQALPLSRQSGAKAEEASILNSLGQLYTKLAAPKTALDFHTQALTLLYQLNDKGSAAATFTSIGDIHADTNKWEQARDAYTQALIISRPPGDLAAEATALAGIGSYYIASAEWVTALNAYQQALIVTRHLNDKIYESTILNQMGKIHTALGDKIAALEHYKQALLISREVGNRLGESIGLNNMAVFYENQGTSADAINYYQKSITIAESIQGDIRLGELKSSFASERIDTYSRLINLLGRQGDFTAAFNYAERAKARAFLDQIANGQIDYRAGADAQLLQKAQDLRQQIDAIERQLINLRNRPKDRWNQNAISAASTQLATLRKADDNLLTQIQLQSPATASLVTVDAAPLAEIQRLLKPDTTLVEYFVTGDRTFAFILTNNSFNAVPLDINREDLVKTITVLRDFSVLDDKIPPEFQQLNQILVEPLQAYLNTSRLIIVPHNILHYLPFAALTDGNRYLGDRYTLSFLPSANLLRFLPASKPSPNNTLLALGDPISAERSGLSYARDEVSTITPMFNATSFIGRDATETRLRSQAPTTNILHLAVHGEYDPINPRSSALYLTADDQNNGRLEVGEIYGLNLTQNTNLVVLSACQTNIGKLSRGDEIVGLNRAFLYAGTPAVLSSLWNVDDKATALLMKHFYTHLRTGSDPATALQQAQRAIRQNPDYTHPYYWSAFSITGRVDPRRRRRP